MPKVSIEWVAELKRGSIQLCLLALLTQGSKYGLQIINELSEMSGGFFDLKEGTLYPALRRLEERGYLKSEWVERESGIPRRYYRITEKGKAVLTEATVVWKEMVQSAEGILRGVKK
ncbi:MAG: PadR family transcriptional regulator [Thermoplasmata archaeon]|nr:PadR family transcriptional regulator [Thermoplasmata archaeon]